MSKFLNLQEMHEFLETQISMCEQPLNAISCLIESLEMIKVRVKNGKIAQDVKNQEKNNG